MKIVIDIPEEEYNAVVKNAEYYKAQNWGSSIVWDAIINGKVKRNCKDCIGSDLWYYAMCSECKNKNKFSRR